MTEEIMKLSGKKAALGLDIGTSSIKIVQVQDTGRGITLARFACAEIPYSQRSKENLDGFIISAIKGMMESAKITAGDVFLTVTGPEVNVNSLTLPKMSKKDLEEAVKLEIRRALPFDFATASFSLQIREELPGNKLRIMAIVAAGSLVKNRIKIAEEAGLSPRGMNVAGCALENLILLSRDIKEDEVVALLDIGAKMSRVNLYQGRQLQFSREVPIGGDHITEMLVRTFTGKDNSKITLDFPEAEELKKKAGIPKEDEEFQGIPGSQILSLIRPVIERLTSEIRRSLGYFRQSFNVSRGVDRILLCGGGSKLKNLENFLTRDLGIKTERFRPFQDIKTEHLPFSRKEDLGEMAPELSLALGLALEKRPKVNLLPLEYKIQEKVNTVKTFFILGFSLIFLLLLFLSVRLFLKNKACRRLMASNKISLSSLEPNLKELENLESLQKRVSERKALLERAIEKQPFFPGILKEISGLSPKEVVLTHISLISDTKPKGLRLEGISYGPYAIANLALSKFLVDLDKSPFFQKVKLISLQKEEGEEPMVSFELTMELIY